MYGKLNEMTGYIWEVKGVTGYVWETERQKD